MTPRPTSAADARRQAAAATPLRLVIVTMDTHLASAVQRARPVLRRELPGLQVSLHAAADYAGNDAATARCIADIEAADIVVAPYLEASQSGVVAEALAHGKPCLVTPVGALAEQIGFGEAGWIADAPDPRAFASKLEQVLESEHQREQLGAEHIARTKWDADCWRWLETVTR